MKTTRTYHLLLALLICFQGIGYSQNLIPNSSFESNTGLPTDAGDWSKCLFWSNVNNQTVFMWPYASPDYLHTGGTAPAGLPGSGFGTVSPHTGEAIMGFVAITSTVQDFREYLSVELTTPMIPGETYTVSFWTTNGSANYNYGGSSNHIGVHFSTGPLFQADHEPVAVVPQLEIPGQLWSVDWEQQTFTIVATAAWTHFTIGVFVPDNQLTVVQQVSAGNVESAYYFVDDFEVTPIPLLSITGDEQICEGESTVLTASGGTTYSWAESTAPTVIIGTGNTLTVSPTEETTYLVYSGPDTADITVEVVPNPVISVSSAEMCPGETTEINVSGADTYVWSPATALNTTTGAAVITSTTATITYTVIGTTNGCSDTAQATMTILPGPEIAVNDATICPGFSATLHASGADDFSWSPSTGLSDVTGASVIASPQTTTIYTITGMFNGCTSTETATVTVTDPLPITVNDFEICAGGTAVLIAEGATTYTWSPDVAFFLPDGSKVTTSPAATTVYTVTGTNADSTCTGTAQATVTLIDHVDMNITAGPNPVLAEDPLVTFHGEPADELLIWHFGDSTSAEGANVQHLYPTGVEGTYPVMLIASTAGGCIDTLYMQIVVQAGGLFYVPNAFTPNGDAYNGQFKPVFSLGFDPSEYQLSIYNRWGELVFETASLSEGWDGTYRSEACMSGVYTWKITAGSTKNAAAKEIVGFVALVR